MKVSHWKTEYMCGNEREASGMVRLQRVDIEKVHEFEYWRSEHWELCEEVKK